MLGRGPPKNCKNDLTIKLDGNWSSFQLANSAPPLSVTGSAIAPSARMACLAHNHTNSRSVLCKEVPTACRASSPRPLAAPSAAKLRSTHCLAPSPLSHPTAQGPQSPPGYPRSRQNRSMGRRDRERRGGYKRGLWGRKRCLGKRKDGQASGREDETTGVPGCWGRAVKVVR